VLLRTCLFLVCSIVAGQAMQTPQLRELVQKAQRAERQGDLPHAIQFYGEMLSIKPHWTSAEFHLARAYDSQGRFPEAIKLLNEIIEHDPGIAEAYLLRGKDYYETNQYQDAIQSLNRVLELQPGNEQVHFYLGATYYQLKDYGRAAASYLEQIRIQPQESDLLFQLIQSYQALQDSALQKIAGDRDAAYFVMLLEAEKDLRQHDVANGEAQVRAAIAASPQLPEAWLLLSQVSLSQRKDEDAKLNRARAVQLEAKGPMRFHGLVVNQSEHTACSSTRPLPLAYCRAAQGMLTAATKLTLSASSEAKDSRTLYWTAAIYQHLAEKATARLAQLSPDSAGLHKLYARAFSQNRRPADAEREYEKAAIADSQDASTFVEFANFRFKQQEFPQAIKLLQRALEITPYDFNLHGLLAQAYVHNNQPALAVPYFSEVLKRDSRNEQLRIDLAECFYVLERTAEAIALLEAAPVDPDGRIAYVLAKYYARQGDTQKAGIAMGVFRQRQKATALGGDSQ
jgi:tetratricopeptide (TPR) repeat protein